LECAGLDGALDRPADSLTNADPSGVGVPINGQLYSWLTYATRRVGKKVAGGRSPRRPPDLMMKRIVPRRGARPLVAIPDEFDFQT